jgi:adenosine deaminase
LNKNNNNDDEKIYPLKQYLSEGLKVTVNTDDPGISLTNITQEYYKAACLTNEGLSKWEILQINRNGFKYGFLKMEEKKRLLMNVEKELFEIVNNE